MERTTIKVSVQTRDRIKSVGGATHEETIVEAIDADFDAVGRADRVASAAARRALHEIS